MTNEGEITMVVEDRVRVTLSGPTKLLAELEIAFGRLGVIVRWSDRSHSSLTADCSRERWEAIRSRIAPAEEAK